MKFQSTASTGWSRKHLWFLAAAVSLLLLFLSLGSDRLPALPIPYKNHSPSNSLDIPPTSPHDSASLTEPALEHEVEQPHVPGLPPTPTEPITQPQPAPALTAVPAKAKKPSDNAYVVFLAADLVNEHEHDLREDKYFVATRMLVYQLLHAPETRTQKGYDVIVVVTPKVSQAKRTQLLEDGAIIHEVQEVDKGWVQSVIGVWGSMMMKFRLWEMTQYKLLALMDSDIVLRDCMDGLFEDPAVAVRRTQTPEIEKHLADEAPYPEEYVLAATSELSLTHTHYPPENKGDKMLDGEYLNAGFLVLKPSKQAFDYYISLTKGHPKKDNGEDLFDKNLGEQALLNWAHRRTGPMPWGELDPLWSIHFPTKEEVDKAQPHSIHDKWWTPRNKGIWPELMEWRGRMRGFYEGRAKATTTAQTTAATLA